MEPPRPRIAVVTLQYGDLPYFAPAAAINAAYCARHGYDWVVAGVDARPPDDRDWVWCKLRGVADLLARGDHEFVLYLDADAWFHDHGMRIEELIARHVEPRTLLLFGTDRRDADFAWSDTDANTGVWLARNTPLTRQIVAEWWHVPCYDERTARDWPVEQRALAWHIRPRWEGRGRIKVIPYHHLNGHDGTFIRHITGEPHDRRAEVIRQAAARLGIPTDV